MIRRGELMSDPSLLVTNPSRTDPSVAPAGRHTYYVLAPVPNLRPGRRSTGAATWPALRRPADRARWRSAGYVGFGDGVEVLADRHPGRLGRRRAWPPARRSPPRTRFCQTGPFRPRNLHRDLSNVVFVGSGTQPGVGVPMVLISGKLAADRITGGGR